MFSLSPIYARNLFDYQNPLDLKTNYQQSSSESLKIKTSDFSDLFFGPIDQESDILGHHSLNFSLGASDEESFSSTFSPVRSSNPAKSSRTSEISTPSSSSGSSRDLTPPRFSRISESLIPSSSSVYESPPRSLIFRSSQTNSIYSNALSSKREEIAHQFTYNGGNFNITPVTYLSPEGDKTFAKGYHSMAYTINSDQRELFSHVENQSLIFKKPLNDTLSRFGNSAVKFFKNPVLQYKKCKEKGIFIAEIFNLDTCASDGFIIQKKVKTFSGAPWSQSQSLEEVKQNPVTKSYLEQIIELCVFNLLYMGEMGMDLKWDNLGLSLDGNPEDENKLILFDFKEELDEFYLLMNIAIMDLSNGNRAIIDEILRQIVRKLDICVEAGEIVRKSSGYFFKDGKEVISNDTLAII